jgi:hypothetical protein
LSARFFCDQGDALIKKLKATTLKKVVDINAKGAGDDNLPCGTSIKFSYENSYLLLKCGAIKKEKNARRQQVCV